MNPEVTAAIAAVNAAQSHLNALRAACKHEHIVPDNPENPEDGDGVCNDCGQATGSWFCPKNPPTHVCEYTEGECCIHCGDPAERL